MSYHPLIVEFRGQQVEIDYSNEIQGHRGFYPDYKLAWDFNEIGMEKSSLNITDAEDKAIRDACEEHAFDQSCMRD